MTVVHSVLAGGDSIDDCDVLRAASTASVLGHGVLTPSTIGTLLRSLTSGLVLPVELVIHGSSPVRARIAFSARSSSSRKSAGTFRLVSSSAKRRRNSIPAVWPWLAWSLWSGS